MIGIIGAMSMEVDGIIEQMTHLEKWKAGGIEFCRGILKGIPCVISCCNPGKVNAALCAQLMISHYQPAAIINSGIAGGIGENVHIHDVVIARSVVQHDLDTSPIGDPKGLISGLGLIEIPADAALAACLAEIAGQIYEGAVHNGVIATGDQFICDSQKLKEIYEEFGALACEMEGGAIGHVCYANGIPFAVLRAISDNANDDAGMDYTQFAPLAAQKGIDLLCQAIPKLNTLLS